jgi:VanZ family protein
VSRRWLAAVLWAAVILAATSIPGRSVPSAFWGADKLVHLGSYAVLGVLVGRARDGGARPDRDGMVRWALALALFGLVDEWHQDLIPGRFSDRNDWIADVVGATLGLVAASTPSRSEQRT